MSVPLHGKVALVTGGSRGIGEAIVRRLADDGAAVAFTYAGSEDAATRLARDRSAAGRRCLAVKADSGDPAQVTEALTQTVDTLGRLDILAASAGLAIGGTVARYRLDDFDRMVGVNLRGVFTAIQAALPHLPAGGRIITIGSVNAERVPLPGMAVYAMTKAGLAGLVRGLARELGERGITVNNIQPGPTATDMNPEHGDFADTMRALMPLGRYAQPGEIAAAVAYLAGPEAGFVTGVSWNIDGGYTV